LSIDIVFFLKGDVLADGKAIRIKSLYLFIALYLASPQKSFAPPCIFIYEEGEELQCARFPTSKTCPELVSGKSNTWRCIDDCSRKSRKSGNCFYLA